MGLLQLLTGVLVIAISIVGLTVGSGKRLELRMSSSIMWQFFLAGGGVWSGPFFIAAGISGISAARSRGGCTLGCVVTCLVFSVIASVLAFFALVTEAILAEANRHVFELSSSSSRSENESAFRAVFGTGIACVLLCVFEFVLAIVHSAYACRASCCCVPAAVQTFQNDHQHQHQHQSQHQQVFLAGQQAYFTSQPGLHPGQQVFSYMDQPGNPPLPGYPVRQAGYPVRQAGYPGLQAGYPGPQAGYPGPQAGTSSVQPSAQLPLSYEAGFGGADEALIKA